MTERIQVATMTESQGFSVVGEASQQSFGIDIDFGGDLNNDGIDDLLIGTRARSGQPNYTYTLFGDDDLFAEINDPNDTLPNMSRTRILANVSNGANSAKSNQVAGVGDINGDGIDDMVTGSPIHNGTGLDSGAAYIRFGTDSGGDFLSSPIYSHVVLPPSSWGNGGNLAADIDGGDLNGDGYSDLIVTAPGGDMKQFDNLGGDLGHINVIFGGPTFESTWSAEIRTDKIGERSDEGFLFGGDGNASNDTGTWVSVLGDINNDGFGDIAVSHVGAYSNAYIIFGRADFAPRLHNPNLNTTDPGNVTEFAFGNQGEVAAAGDFNNDGFQDVALARPRADASGTSLQSVYVLYGSEDGIGNVGSLNGQYRFSDFDESHGSLIDLGFANQVGDVALSTAGDFNGDGIDDIVIGDPEGFNSDGVRSGLAYVVFGTETPQAGGMHISELDGTNGIVIEGEQANAYFGSSVSYAGDLNNDGAGDVAISAPRTDVFGDSDGEIHVIFGTPAIVPGDLVTGTTSRDYLTGTAGNDTILGLGGHDFLTGRAGDDLLVGDSGNDVLDGGDGGDRYEVGGTGDGFDRFADSGVDGTDTVIATADGTRIGLYGSISGIETIAAGGFADVYIQGTSSRDALDFSQTTLTGITRIDGAGGHDIITGSAAADTIIGNSGNDVLDGGDGGDRYEVGGTGDGFDRFADSGGDGIDTVIATADGTRIGLYGSISGIETIAAGGFADVYIQGTSSRDTLDFSQTTLTGITRIDGAGGHDIITGSDAADTIVGNTGNDVLAGGGGADVFQYDSAGYGSDRIVDFTAGNDRIDLSGLGVALGDLDTNGDSIVSGLDDAAATSSGGDLVLSVGGGTVTFTGIQSLAVADFLL